MALVIYDNDIEGRRMRHELVGEHYWVGMTNWVRLKADLEKATVGCSFVRCIAPMVRFATQIVRHESISSVMPFDPEGASHAHITNPMIAKICRSDNFVELQNTQLKYVAQMISLLCWSLRCILFTGPKLTNQLKSAGILKELGYLLLGVQRLCEESGCASHVGRLGASAETRIDKRPLLDCITPALLTVIQLIRVTARESTVLVLPEDKRDGMLCCEAAIACAR